MSPRIISKSSKTVFSSKPIGVADEETEAEPLESGSTAHQQNLALRRPPAAPTPCLLLAWSISQKFITISDAAAHSHGHAPASSTHTPWFPRILSSRASRMHISSEIVALLFDGLVSPSPNQNLFWLKGGDLQAEKASCNFVCCLHACYYGMTSWCDADCGLLQRF